MLALIADDDNFFLTIMTDVLEAGGWEVIQVRTGPEVLKKVFETTPDLIILDVILPGLQGTDVSQRLRKHAVTASVPILLISGGVAELQKASGGFRDFLADDFLQKPFPPERLLDKANELHKKGSSFSTQEKDLVLKPSPWVERRRNPRLTIDIQVSAKTAEVLLYHPAINISTGGICIESDRHLQKERKLDLRFPVPGKVGLVAAEGEVAWCQEVKSRSCWELGVRFTKIDQDDLDKIQEYINTLLILVRPRGPK